MTPRALLTSIVATAIAFAVAIGVAAGSSYGTNASQSTDFAQTAAASDATLSGTSLDGPLL